MEVFTLQDGRRGAERQVVPHHRRESWRGASPVAMFMLRVVAKRPACFLLPLPPSAAGEHQRGVQMCRTTCCRVLASLLLQA